VGGAAVLAVLNVGGVVWVGGAVLACLVLAVVRRVPWRTVGIRAGVLAGLGAVLALPTLVTAHGFFHTIQRQLTGERTPGNLIHPLSVLQVVGIWPSGDFRFTPGHAPLAYALIAVALAAAAFGLWTMVRTGVVELPLYVGVTLVGCAILAAVGSAWVDAKVLATASPAILLAGLAGLSLLADGRQRALAATAAALVVGGVLWSNILAVHDVWLAPRDQLVELEHIGSAFSGQGPALLNEYQVDGARHFLRSLDAEGSGVFRRRHLYLRNGSEVQKSGYADIDLLQLESLLVYRTLVLPRSPVASRPPSPYRLIWSGRYYEVWQRAPAAAPLLDHIPLGTSSGAARVPSCGEVLHVAAVAARAGGRVAFVRRPPVISVPLGPKPRSLRVAVTLPADGTYRAWIDGSFAGRLEVLVDGRSLGAHRHRLEHGGQLVPFGAARLAAGRHELALRYSGADLHPGSGAGFDGISRLVLGALDSGPPSRDDRAVSRAGAVRPESRLARGGRLVIGPAKGGRAPPRLLGLLTRL